MAAKMRGWTRIVALIALAAPCQGEADVEEWQCKSWAAQGECIRNPAYMFTHCRPTCDAGHYQDVDDNCHVWSIKGECEKNPIFMFSTCNHSCITAAKRSIESLPQAARPNEQYDHKGSTPSRVMSFLPVFGVVFVILMTAALLESTFSKMLIKTFPAVFHTDDDQGSKFHKYGRMLICMYFVNEGISVIQTSPSLSLYMSSFLESDGLWEGGHAVWTDSFHIMAFIAAILCISSLSSLTSILFMLADIAIGSYVLLAEVVYLFVEGQSYQLSELMVKKISMFGCVVTMLAFELNSRKRKRTSFPGMLLEKAVHISPTASMFLLCGRLLIASLFFYVGCEELHRLYFEPYTKYLPGDGHDLIWPKCVQILLALPFAFGWRVSTVSRLLAVSLTLEAFYAWNFWSDLRGETSHLAGHRRQLHYREHFVTNLATAGGLILLQSFGAGSFTMDEYLGKKE